MGEEGIGLTSKTILITGGARSGKSRFAQELAAKLGEPVLFVATAVAGDQEMLERMDTDKAHL
jgi:adenosylcobinamide kinase/adenosylcobinamide-phosphate guanylyltransferase